MIRSARKPAVAVATVKLNDEELTVVSGGTPKFMPPGLAKKLWFPKYPFGSRSETATNTSDVDITINASGGAQVGVSVEVNQNAET